MTTPRGKINKAPFQPYRVAGFVVFLIAALVLWLVFLAVPRRLHRQDPS